MTGLFPIVDPKRIVTRTEVASSGAFARMIANFRHHHLVIDAPDYANGPGQAPMPPELFISAIGGCAIGMFELLAARDNIPLRRCSVAIESAFDPLARNEAGVTLFQRITFKFLLQGISTEEGEALVATFQGSCPLYGSIKTSCAQVDIELQTSD